MISKTIQYHDLDGDIREDEFYFSMNETQYARVNRLFPGGLQEFAMNAAKNKNPDDMFMVIDTLVRESYGVKMNEGFVKVAPNGQKLADFFVNTEAYDKLLIELMKDQDTFIAFMTGCLNKAARDRVNAEIQKNREENGGELKLPVSSNAEGKPSLNVVK